VPELRAVTHSPAPTLAGAVLASISGMSWTTPADEALTALALRLAREIDEAEERHAEFGRIHLDPFGDEARMRRLEAACDVTKTIATLAPQLLAALRDLGGAPGSRKNIAATQQVGGRLAQLRAAASDR